MEGVQMSDYTIPTSNTVTTIDPQATKIRELQSDVNELKELVEYLRDKIKRMEELGDTLANCTSDNPYNARYAEQWWDLRGIKHE
jgi:hypothetical protein